MDDNFEEWSKNKKRILWDEFGELYNKAPEWRHGLPPVEIWFWWFYKGKESMK